MVLLSYLKSIIAEFLPAPLVVLSPSTFFALPTIFFSLIVRLVRTALKLVTHYAYVSPMLTCFCFVFVLVVIGL